MRFLMRVVAKALAIMYLLPAVAGIYFHGGILTAVLLAVFFSVMLWSVELLAVGMAAVLTVGTFGLALLVLIPLWILGFWALPAFALKIIADLLPQYLTVSGWSSAVIGGLVLLLVNMITGGVASLFSGAGGQPSGGHA